MHILCTPLPRKKSGLLLECGVSTAMMSDEALPESMDERNGRGSTKIHGVHVRCGIWILMVKITSRKDVLFGKWPYHGCFLPRRIRDEARAYYLLFVRVTIPYAGH